MRIDGRRLVFNGQSYNLELMGASASRLVRDMNVRIAELEDERNELQRALELSQDAYHDTNEELECTQARLTECRGCYDEMREYRQALARWKERAQDHREEWEAYQAELEKCREAFKRIAAYLHPDLREGWLEQAYRTALWNSTPGHPADESSGPDADVYHRLHKCREALEARTESQNNFTKAWRHAEQAKQSLEAENGDLREERDMLAMAMTDYGAEAEHQERERAAAEAQLLEAKEALEAIPHPVVRGGGWNVGLSLSDIDYKLDGVAEILDADSHDALAGALESRTIEVLETVWDYLRDDTDTWPDNERTGRESIAWQATADVIDAALEGRTIEILDAARIRCGRVTFSPENLTGDEVQAWLAFTKTLDAALEQLVVEILDFVEEFIDGGFADIATEEWATEDMVEAYHNVLDAHGHHIDRLRAKNTELREVLKALQHADGCYCDAAFAGPDGSHPSHAPECQRARELLGEE